MKTYGSLVALYTSQSNNIQSDNQVLGAQLINDGYRKMLGQEAWPFLQQDLTLTTVSEQQFYTVPPYLSKPASVTVTIDNQVYTPLEATSKQFWTRLNVINNITSDYPEYWYYFDGQIGLYPTPSTTGNTITITSKVVVKDLSLPDYSIGSIYTLINGSTVVVGTASSVWTTPMVGEFIRVTDSLSPNKGDGYWYRIASVQDPTHLTLERTYGGNSVTAGTAAYVIGQVPELPENYQQMPVWYALSEYWDTNDDENRATKYSNKYNELMVQMKGEFLSASDGVVIDYGRRRAIANPNLFITSNS